MDDDERRRRDRERHAHARARQRQDRNEATGTRVWPLIVNRPVPDLTNGYCAGLGDLMFPEGEGRRDLVDAALRVCRACPLQQPCLDYAIRAGERHGIWGGRDFDTTARREARLDHAEGTEAAATDTHQQHHTREEPAMTDHSSTATDTSPAGSAATAAQLTAVDAFRLGIRAGELIAEAYQTNVSGRVLEVILTELVERQDLDLLARVVDVLDDDERRRDAEQAIADQRAEQASQEAASALLVACETCGRPEGQACVNPAGKPAQKPHSKRLRAAHRA